MLAPIIEEIAKEFEGKAKVLRNMKITIIYDNTAFRKDLQADWGFSALIEAENTPKILWED